MASRRDEDFDVGSVAAYRVRQIQSVFRARHIDVGEHRLDVRNRAKDCNGFDDIAGFDDLETGLFQSIDDIPANESIVLDDKHGIT